MNMSYSKEHIAQKQFRDAMSPAEESGLSFVTD